MPLSYHMAGSESESLLPVAGEMDEIVVNRSRTTLGFSVLQWIFVFSLLLCGSLVMVVYDGDDVKLSFKKSMSTSFVTQYGGGDLTSILDSSNGVSSCCCDCTTEDYEYDISTNTCSRTDAAAMGGLDLVEIYIQGDVNQDFSYVGKAEDGTFRSVYGKYTYFFNSQKNLNLFEKSPSKYIPQYGGYCALGISIEWCPNYSWDKECLGPAIETNAWTLHNGKLYFFTNIGAKTSWLQEIDKLIDIADARWSEWYSTEEAKGDYLINTACYREEDGEFDPNTQGLNLLVKPAE
jgi:YHS domain-containing protein